LFRKLFSSIIHFMKTNREKKISDAAQIYVREFQLLKRVNEIKNGPFIPREELLNEYIKIGTEYAKLLRQAIKITRIGDSNQRKLLLANEEIEHQREELSIAYKKMETLARTDPLTGISNRRDFYEKFQDEIHRFDATGNLFP